MRDCLLVWTPSECHSPATQSGTHLKYIYIFFFDCLEHYILYMMLVMLFGFKVFLFLSNLCNLAGYFCWFFLISRNLLSLHKHAFTSANSYSHLKLDKPALYCNSLNTRKHTELASLATYHI